MYILLNILFLSKVKSTGRFTSHVRLTNNFPAILRPTSRSPKSDNPSWTLFLKPVTFCISHAASFTKPTLCPVTILCTSHSAHTKRTHSAICSNSCFRQCFSPALPTMYCFVKVCHQTSGNAWVWSIVTTKHLSVWQF